jgi:hypothetical protein
LLGWFPNILRRGNKRSSSSSSSVGVAGSDMLLPNSNAWGAFGDAGSSEAMQYAGLVPGVDTGLLPQQQAAGWAGSNQDPTVGLEAGALGGQLAALKLLKLGSLGSSSLGGTSTAVGSTVGNMGGAGVGGISSGLPSAGAGMTQGAGAGGNVAAGQMGTGAGSGGFAGGAGAGAAGAFGASLNVNVPNPLAGLPRRNTPPPAFQNPNWNFIPPETQGVTPRSQPVPQGAGAQLQPLGPSGVGLVWPPAGGVKTNTPSPASVLSVGVPGLGGYQLLPPGYDAEAVRRAAQVCPGINRIMQIQERSGIS